MIKRIFAAILLMSLFVLQFILPSQFASAEAGISIESTVTATPDNLYLEYSNRAESSINIQVTPKGVAPNTERAPVDVVFVFDKSGSMMERVAVGREGYHTIYKSKLALAKEAMAKAIGTFQANNKGNDRFALVAFDSGFNASASRTELNSNLEGISAKINNLSNVTGGTNYTSALDMAKTILVNGRTDTLRKQHIIFLTDGKPTESQKIEPLFNDSFMQYALLQDSWGRGIARMWSGNQYYIDSRDASAYSYVQNEIEKHAKDKAKEIADEGILLNSIGFGSGSTLNMDLLNEISQMSHGKAEQVTNVEIIDIFEKLSENLSSNIPILSGGHILFTLPEHVYLKNIDQATKLPNNQYRINIDPIKYDPTPLPTQRNFILPLEFDKAGSYQLDFKVIYIYNGTEYTANQTVTVKVNKIQLTSVEFSPITIEVGEAVNLNGKLKIAPFNATNQFIKSMTAGSTGAFKLTRESGMFQALGMNPGFDTIEAIVSDGEMDLKAVGTIIVKDKGTTPTDPNNPGSGRKDEYKW